VQVVSKRLIELDFCVCLHCLSDRCIRKDMLLFRTVCAVYNFLIQEDRNETNIMACSFL